MISGSDNGHVCFITSKSEVKKTTILNDMKGFSELETTDPSLFKRLNYAKGMLMNLINPKKAPERAQNPSSKKEPKKKFLLRSETKENNYKFSRKNSETSDRVIDFYATQNLDTQSRESKTFRSYYREQN